MHLPFSPARITNTPPPPTDNIIKLKKCWDTKFSQMLNMQRCEQVLDGNVGFGKIPRGFFPWGIIFYLKKCFFFVEIYFPETPEKYSFKPTISNLWDFNAINYPLDFPSFLPNTYIKLPINFFVNWRTKQLRNILSVFSLFGGANNLIIGHFSLIFCHFEPN